jgi:hypothetical protein
MDESACLVVGRPKSVDVREVHRPATFLRQIKQDLRRLVGIVGPDDFIMSAPIRPDPIKLL